MSNELIGLRIKLERTIDKPCACGETAVSVGEGAGPHIASLRCTGCDCHRGWLPKVIASFLTETIGRFGQLTDPIVMQNSSLPADAGAPAEK
jgi:hypothetical protein